MKNTAKSVRQLFPKLILQDLRKFPIKQIEISKQKPFIRLVDQIQKELEKNSSADISTYEQQIDEMVYKLYDLTEEEIKIIEVIN